VFCLCCPVYPFTCSMCPFFTSLSIRVGGETQQGLGLGTNAMAGLVTRVSSTFPLLPCPPSLSRRSPLYVFPLLRPLPPSSHPSLSTACLSALDVVHWSCCTCDASAAASAGSSAGSCAVIRYAACPVIACAVIACAVIAYAVNLAWLAPCILGYKLLHVLR